MHRLGGSRYSESEYSETVVSPVPSDYNETSPARKSSDVRWGIRSPNFERSASTESLDDRGSVCSNYSKADGEFIPTRTTSVSAKPAPNAMQFVKTGPAKLVQTAQEQLKKAEEMKKVKVVVKDDDDSWQSNLEGWKMNRRKRQEPVIQRVAEVKRFEQEGEMRAFESKSRKVRSFSEMLGRTNSRKQSIGFYPGDDEGGSFDFGQGGDEPLSPSSELDHPHFPVSDVSRELAFDETSNSESVKESSVISDFRTESRDGIERISEVQIRTERDFSPIKRREQSPKKTWTESSSAREVRSSVQTVNTVTESRYTEFNGSGESISNHPTEVKESSAVQIRYHHQMNENSKEKKSPERKPREEITANVKMRRSLFERQSSGEISSSGSDSRRKSGEISDGLRSKLQDLSTAGNSIVNEEAKFLSQRRKSLEMSEGLKNKLQSMSSGSNLVPAEAPPKEDQGLQDKLTSFQAAEKTVEPRKIEITATSFSLKSKVMNFELKQEPGKPAGKPVPGRLAAEFLSSNSESESEKPVSKPIPGRLASDLIRPSLDRSQSEKTSASEKETSVAKQASGRFTSELIRPNFERPEPNKPTKKTIPGRLSSDFIRSNFEQKPELTKPVFGRVSSEQSIRAGSADRPVPGKLPANAWKAPEEKDSPVLKPIPGRLASEPIRSKSAVEVKCDRTQSSVCETKVQVLVEDSVDFGKKWNTASPERPWNGRQEESSEHWEPETVLLAPAVKLPPPTSKPPPPPVEESSSEEEEEDARSKSPIIEARNSSSALRSLDTSPQSLESASFMNLEAHSPISSRHTSPSKSDTAAPTRYIVSQIDAEFDELTRKEMEIILSLEQEEESRLKRLVKKSQGFGPASLDTSGTSDDQDHLPSSLNGSYGSSSEPTGYEQLNVGHSLLAHMRTNSDPFRVVPRPSVAQDETRPESADTRPSPVTSKPPVQDLRLNGSSKDQQRRLLPKAPSVDYLDTEVSSSLRPVRKEDNKRDISRHWLIQEAEQRRIESQTYRSNDSLPTSDAPPTVLLPPITNQSFPRSSSMGSIARHGGGSENLSQSSSSTIFQSQSPNLRARGPSPSTQEAHVALSGCRSGPLRSSSTDYLSGGYWEVNPEERLVEEPVKRAQSASHLQSDYMNLRDIQQSMVAQTRGSYADSSRSSNRSSQLSGSGPAPQVPSLPPRTSSSEKGSRERMLSVSGKKKCSQCSQELGRGAAMIIETLRLYYHMDCFRCCVCQSTLGSGLSGTDVRVRNAMLHCRNCYSNDDGFKFSKV